MRSLITGIAGFAGRHLAALLAARSEEVFGLDRAARDPGVPGAAVLAADIRDADAVERTIRQIRPSRVYHLAGTTVVGESFEAPAEAFAANATGTLNLLGAVRRHAPAARVLVVASSEIYGREAETVGPITEAHPLKPGSPYAVSKAAADLLAYQHFRAYGLDVIRVRPFNHTGPGQRPEFVCASFAMQIARAEAGLAEPLLRVGNLDVERDFTDVRDVVRAYASLMELGVAGEAYNVCSGRATALRDVVGLLVRACRTRIDVVVDRARVRNMDPPRIVGDPSKIRGVTGWTAEYPIDTTLADLLDWFRGRVPAQQH